MDRSVSRARALGFARPRESRGILPLIAAAMGIGAVKGIVGAIQGNQTKQRNKGFINKNYAIAQQRLGENQGRVRADTMDELSARGLGGPIFSAMNTGDAHTLGEQAQVNNDKQFALERTDLKNQRDQALATNKADYNNTLLNAGVGAVNTAFSAYSAGKDLSALRAPSSPIASAMLSGGAAEPPQLGFGNVDVVDPLGHPSSAWYQGGKSLNGAGLSNDQFHVGNG